MPKKVKRPRKAKVKRRQKSLAQQAREQEYKKVRTRVQHRLSDYRTKGYDVSGIKVPAIPKRITEGSIRSLSKITPEYIRKHSTVATAMDISTGDVTETISGEQYYQEKQKEARRRAVQTRKRKKEKPAPPVPEPEPQPEPGDNYGGSVDEGYDYSGAPHIGDLIAERIRDIISRYNVEDSNWGKQMEYWLQEGESRGTIINLASWNDTDINDVDIDAFYVSRGQPPKRGSLEALKITLTGKPMTAEEASRFEDFTDGEVTKADEESYFGPEYDDDEDDY